jgi:hypothetical protein
MLTLWRVKTEYWISDVQASYTSIRKLLLQAPKGAITSLGGGFVLLGADTTTIDLPTRGRDSFGKVTLSSNADLFRYNLHVDADWIEDPDQDGLDPTQGSWADSLSMFGSSMYADGSERGREGGLNVDADDAVMSPRNMPFTVHPNTIHRKGAEGGIGDATEDDIFDIDNLALPVAPAGQDIQLDLGLDPPVEYPAMDDAFDDRLVDDVQGFELPVENDAGMVQPNDHEDVDIGDQRPSKRQRVNVPDRIIRMSDAQWRRQLDHYAAIMANARGRLLIKAMTKQAELISRDTIFGPANDLAASPALVSIWTKGMQAALDVHAEENVEPDQSKAPILYPAQGHDQMHEPTVEYAADDLQPYDEPPPIMDMTDVDVPRASTPAWGSEIGRASNTQELPWNRSVLEQQAIGADETGVADTTIGVSTRSFSIETPKGLRRPGRQSSLSGRASVDRTVLDEMTPLTRQEHVGGEEGVGDESRVADQPTMLEQDMLNFLAYARMVQERQDDTTLFFSDLAPVADTTVGVVMDAISADA